VPPPHGRTVTQRLPPESGESSTTVNRKAWGEEVDRLVVVTNDQGDGGNRVRHDSILYLQYSFGVWREQSYPAVGLLS